jgi:uncharacterized cysteine cluster protein YcgN (CxxCxxCC family)
MKNYTKEEWENICRRCGKCCLIKLEDEETGDIYYTNVVCKYFNEETMSCTIYDKRTTLVPECLKLDANNVDKLCWMPKTCAYRELFEKNPSPVKTTIKGRCVRETDVNPDDIEDYIVEWEDL